MFAPSRDLKINYKFSHKFLLVEIKKTVVRTSTIFFYECLK